MTIMLSRFHFSDATEELSEGDLVEAAVTVAMGRHLALHLFLDRQS
jgi:hypothetical protein